MPAIVVRNISAETHRALKTLAAKHGRSTEAEVREILELASRPERRLKLGTELAALGKKFGGIELGVTRDKSPAGTVRFK